jgi:hypothetical protein
MRLHEIKRLLHKKEVVSKLKRPPIEWKKTLGAIHQTRD